MGARASLANPACIPYIIHSINAGVGIQGRGHAGRCRDPAAPRPRRQPHLDGEGAMLLGARHFLQASLAPQNPLERTVSTVHARPGGQGLTCTRGVVHCCPDRARGPSMTSCHLDGPGQVRGSRLVGPARGLLPLQTGRAMRLPSKFRLAPPPNGHTAVGKARLIRTGSGERPGARAPGGVGIPPVPGGGHPLPSSNSHAGHVLGARPRAHRFNAWTRGGSAMPTDTTISARGSWRARRWATVLANGDGARIAGCRPIRRHPSAKRPASVQDLPGVHPGPCPSTLRRPHARRCPFPPPPAHLCLRGRTGCCG